ncbi:Endonuclease I [Lentibacillus halodurans]|uniref:Endonuclease I n=1 Tax=Lentibacillus halodurans TaxID=237679 RepID=A0A1I0XXA5_9BACI|nr:endonuclease [Lentibacillus halodurans]SFB04788.1 Endonuclease I [Lentibacillus halodurans]
MALTPSQKESLFPVPVNHDRLQSILDRHYEIKERMKKDEKEYYDEEKDTQVREQYYRSIHFDGNGDEVIQSLEELLKETHTDQVPYEPVEYVYPWVDLRPNGSLKSIYSGANRQAEDVIKADFEASLKRKEMIDKLTPNGGWDQLVRIADDFPYNCEHVVPQSWFNERVPMRGDIHHLFTCNPDCNSFRSNYPYHDFAGYNPQTIGSKQVEDACGKAEDGLFEPEYGKGTAARAMLYFLIRYPDKIEQSHKETIDRELLLKWHQQFPPDLYERHRNQAIYEIQGNRNPFIDYPDEMIQLFNDS